MQISTGPIPETGTYLMNDYYGRQPFQNRLNPEVGIDIQKLVTGEKQPADGINFQIFDYQTGNRHSEKIILVLMCFIVYLFLSKSICVCNFGIDNPAKDSLVSNRLKAEIGYKRP